MIGALIILAVTVAIGVLLYILDRTYYSKRQETLLPTASDSDSKPDNAEEQGEALTPDSSGEEGESEECCGMHAVCEKTSLSPLSTEFEYYDDEELDRFKGRLADSYTPEECEEFREVLMTLLPADVAGWSRSLQVREIALPEDVREELLMIVREMRDNAVQKQSEKNNRSK